MANYRDSTPPRSVRNSREPMKTVYHHTSLAHLPWILADGALRGHDLKLANLAPDGVWATTSPTGDNTAGATAHFRQGNPAVRFSFPEEQFRPWKHVMDEMGRDPAEIRKMLKVARQRGVNPSTWRASAEDVPVSAATAIDVKFPGEGWEPLEVPTDILPFPIGGADPTALGFPPGSQVTGALVCPIRDLICVSARIEHPTGPRAHALTLIPEDEWKATAA